MTKTPRIHHPLIPLLLLLLFLVHPAAADNNDTSEQLVHVEYFYDPACVKCEAATPVIEAVLADYQGKIRYEKYSVKTNEGLSKAREYEIPGVPTLILNGRVYIGYSDYRGDTALLEKLLREKLDQALLPAPDLHIEKTANPRSANIGSIISITTTITNTGNTTAHVNFREVLNQNVTLVAGTTTWTGRLKPGDNITYAYTVRVNKLDYGTYQLPTTVLSFNGGEVSSEELSFNVRPTLSLPSILAVGVFAGFNPCLFAILAFIASIALSTTGKRRNVLYIVIAFSLGIFTTYLTFGLGLLQVITPDTQEGIRGFLVLLLVVLGLWQVYDAYHLRKNEESSFRTPKIFINVTQQAAEKANLPASFFLGSLFSLIKAPCVGALYLLILDMVRSGDSTGILYLAAYNLGVILPILLIGAAIVFGLNPDKVESFRKNRRVTLRLITGATLLILAVLMQQKII